jgi:hypothetical protein
MWILEKFCYRRRATEAIRLVLASSQAVGTSATAIVSWTAPPWMVVLTATSDYRQSASALGTNQHSRKRIFRRSTAREQPDPAITSVVFPKPSQSILDRCQSSSVTRRSPGAECVCHSLSDLGRASHRLVPGAFTTLVRFHTMRPRCRSL